MMRMVGIEIVAQLHAVGSIDGMQIARARHGVFDGRRDRAKVVNKDRLAAVAEFQAGGADFLECEIRPLASAAVPRCGHNDG